ncbi:MAG: hypothetical protein IJX78_07820 [Bacilli bacterium]|nr:hypothetical protein [Bacilli bacterium]
MKKIFTMLLLGIYLPFMFACGNETPDNPDDNPTDNPGEIIPPNNEPTEYDLYLEELNEIVSVEKGKIFERYDDFTDEPKNFMYFGDYPGRVITNEDLIKELDKITTTNEFGYIEFENLSFIKVTIENTYDSLEIGDEAFENYTKFEIGSTHYFLVEPLLWRVLTYNPETDKAFLISNNIVDAQMFVNETSDRFIDGRVIYPSNYEYSDVRKWCNNEFYQQAFTAGEKNMIPLTSINNQYINYFSNHIYDKDTEDYVFLPSYKEMTSKTYGYETSGIFSYSRFSEPTDYASAKGVYTSSLEEDIPSSGLYLLRSGLDHVRSYAYFVKFDGYSLNPYYVNSPSTGVRVCIKPIIPDAEK